MRVPHGPEAATGSITIVDPEINKVYHKYHAACKDEVSAQNLSVTADVLGRRFSKLNGHKSVQQH